MKKIGLLIAIILGIVACKKDTVEPNKNEETTIKNEIIIGDYSGMNVYYNDTILIGGYHNLQSLEIDINNDSINDLKLISEVWGSPGLGQNPCSKIWCLNNNIRLFGLFKNDTSFLNRVTRIESGADNSILIYEYYNYTCHRIDINDSILKIYNDRFKIQPKDKNEKININDIFKSDSVTLIDDWYSYPYWRENSGKDTFKYTISNFYNDCNNFPLDEIKYIGFKLLKNNKEKLGWIKVSIMDKYKILILESAIQK